MSTLNSRTQRFSRIAVFCLAASALLPMAAHAGGHGDRGNAAQPAANQDLDRLRQQVSVLERRIAELENKAVEQVALSEDPTGRGEGLRRMQQPKE